MTKPVLSRKASMVAGGLAVYLRPKLAADAKIDLPDILKGLSGKNFKTEAPKIAIAVEKALTGKLAKDASLADIGKVMDEMNEVPVEEGADADPNSGLPMGLEEMKKKTVDADPAATVRQLLAGKVDPAVIEQVCAAMGGAAPGATDEETEEEKKKKAEDAEVEEKDKKAMDAALKNMVSKTDLEKAVKLAGDNAVKTQMAIREAEKAVRPYVGELAVASDSAEGVYQTTLKMLGLAEDELKELPLAALKAVLKAQPLPGDKKHVTDTYLAADAAVVDSYSKLFPEAARLGGNR